MPLQAEWNLTPKAAYVHYTPNETVDGIEVRRYVQDRTVIEDTESSIDLGTKGSGQTPWSRTADGRLTLKGGVREVLAAARVGDLVVVFHAGADLDRRGRFGWRGRGGVGLLACRALYPLGSTSVEKNDCRSSCAALSMVYAFPDRAAMRADSVTREQVYDDAIKNGASEMEAELAAMRAIKHALDPDNIMNPGKIFSW